MLRRIARGLLGWIIFWITLSLEQEASGLDVNGSYIDLGDERGPFAPGDEVSYRFCINGTSQGPASDVTLIISSSRLQFDSNQTITNVTSWKLTINMSDPVDRDTADAHSFNESLAGADYVLSLYNISAEDFAVCGNFSMFLNGTIRLGARFQVEIRLYASTDGATTDYVETVQSEVAYTLVPHFNMETDYPERLHVGEYARMYITMGLPEGSIEPFVETEMPYNSGPLLGVTDLGTSFKGDNVHYEYGSGTGAIFWSTEYWTRYDIAWNRPGRFDVIGGSPENETNQLKLEVEARMEDQGLDNGTEVWLSGGVRFGDGLIWVAQVPVYMEELEDRKPKLDIEISVHTQATLGNLHYISYAVRVNHVIGTSSAYAHNVTITWYSLPEVVLDGITNSQHIRSGGIHTEQTGDVIVTWIDEVLFSDHASFVMKIHHRIDDWYPERFPLDYILFAEAHYYLVTSEREEVLEHPVLTLVFDMRVTYEVTEVANLTCPCEYDLTLPPLCACCGGATCQCGEQNPTKCAPCDSLWQCLRARDGHERVVEKEDGSNLYVCSWERNREHGEGGTCFLQETTSGPWEEMSPALGTIQGRTSSHWFATTNNGFGCMQSEDAVNWFAVQCSRLDAAISDATWDPTSEVTRTPAEQYYTRNLVKTEEELQEECEHQPIALQNPSFEEDLDGWTVVAMDANHSMNGNHGNGSCRLGDGSGAVSQVINLGTGYSGVVCTVDCLVEVAPVDESPGSAVFGLSLTAKDASGSVIGSHVTPCSAHNNTAWFTTQANVQTGSVDIREVAIDLVLANASAGVVYFDHVQLWAVPHTDPTICLV